MPHVCHIAPVHEQIQCQLRDALSLRLLKLDKILIGMLSAN